MALQPQAPQALPKLPPPSSGHGPTVLCSVRGGATALLRSGAPLRCWTSASLCLLAASPRTARRRGRTARRLFGWASSLVEAPAEKLRRELDAELQEVNAWEPRLASLTDHELLAQAGALRARARAGETLEELLPEAFALVREGSKRTLQLRHFDVQILGGITLHRGQVAEMATGEGKTLVAILPAFLNALTGHGVHVVTTNDYLARRDAAWVGQVLRFLGLTVGVIQADMSSAQKREAYRCDVTYVTNQQLGFDYLRDQLACVPEELRHRQENPFNCAIVDEADSVLIDEGRTPLVVSAQAEIPSEKYSTALEVASSLEKDIHYTVLEKEKTCMLTEQGEELASRALEREDLFDPQDPWAPFIVNALTAKELYQRDQQYIVRENAVVVVDEYTGRPVDGRSWSDGLQQAIEAKEKVEIQKEAIVLASISYQCLFRMYQKLAGMTGTASAEAEEFQSIYGLEVRPVPCNKPCQRMDEEDEIYTSEAGKWRAVTEAVCEAYELKRPVLVGTTSIESSELLAERLRGASVPFYLLNAKPENAAREAEVIAAGGRLGAVTIATNMAGRGTDIILGGDGKAMAKLHLEAALCKAFGEEQERPLELCLPLPHALAQEMADAAAMLAANAPEDYRWSLAEAAICDGIQDEVSSKAFQASLNSLKEVYQRACEDLSLRCSAEGETAKALGGLRVLGTERQHAQRIDQQLRGRAGRQGDPGSSRFYLSLTDKVIETPGPEPLASARAATWKVFRVFGGDSIRLLTADMGGADDVPIVSPLVSGAVNEAQAQVQSFFFGIRKDVFKYDEVLDQQRRVIYSVRRKALLDSDEEVLGSLKSFCEETMVELVDQMVNVDEPLDAWPLERLAFKLSAVFVNSWATTAAELRAVAEGGGTTGAARAKQLGEWMQQKALEAMEQKAELIDEDAPELSKAVYRQVFLMQIDNYWRKHLKYMNFLRTYSKFRSYGQKDPLVEYKLEAYKAFQVMMGKIRRDTMYYLFTFMPRPLHRVQLEATEATKATEHPDGPGPVVPGAPAAAEAEQLRAFLEGLDRPVASLRSPRLQRLECLACLVHDSGSSGAELVRWLRGEGFEVWEDAFAKASYVSLDTWNGRSPKS
ncbi:unnamed protein product [Durusdinium trenchii]|uniref:Protein translocase subunit SecA n=1 Tax=Durusdinium trenchii TaxID=1381693 RepID=A0ABP0KRA5_9DINO